MYDAKVWLRIVVFWMAVGFTAQTVGQGKSGGVVVEQDGAARLARIEPQPWRSAPELDQLPQVRLSLGALERELKRQEAVQLERLDAQWRFMHGLQRIDRVQLQDGDIVLLGPGEAWESITPHRAVGRTTRRPVMLLDDWLIAWRAFQRPDARLALSLDPSPEGLVRLLHRLDGRPRFSPQLARTLLADLGPQRVSVEGLPADSHVVRTLLAADVRMKWLALQLGPPAPIALPGFLQVSRSKALVAPRWWLTNNARFTEDPATTCWRLQGQRVQVRVRVDPLAGEQPPANAGRDAQRWAHLLDQNYSRLGRVYPEFFELEQVMDMCLTAALIQQLNLHRRLGPLAWHDRKTTTSRGTEPQAVASGLAIQRRPSRIALACGGVVIEPSRSWRDADDDPAESSSTFCGIPISGRRVVFLVDNSHSMLRELQGQSLWSFARQELEQSIADLPADRSFAVCTFADRVQAWEPCWVSATGTNKRECAKWIAQQAARPGTNTGEALLRALHLRPAPDEIFLLSDGWPTSGPLVTPERLIAVISRQNQRVSARLHTIGVGCGESQRRWLKKLAESNLGRSRFIDR